MSWFSRERCAVINFDPCGRTQRRLFAEEMFAVTRANTHAVSTVHLLLFGYWGKLSNLADLHVYITTWLMKTKHCNGIEQRCIQWHIRCVFLPVRFFCCKVLIHRRGSVHSYVKFNKNLLINLYVPPGLTIKNSTWRLLCVECFVWISEQTATVALYSINWLAFITVVESVYCAVRTDSLYKADYISSLKG